jgi:hypothetical protein
MLWLTPVRIMNLYYFHRTDSVMDHTSGNLLTKFRIVHIYILLLLLDTPLFSNGLVTFTDKFRLFKISLESSEDSESESYFTVYQ